MAAGGFFAASGALSIYYLGTFMPWRQVAFIGLGVPVFAVLAITFIPESPRWLLSKNRSNDAVKSLQFLRGKQENEETF